jgi:hypothetical protein
LQLLQGLAQAPHAGITVHAVHLELNLHVVEILGEEAFFSMGQRRT